MCSLWSKDRFLEIKSTLILATKKNLINIFVSPIKFHIIPFADYFYKLPFSDFAFSLTSATISDSNMKLELSTRRTFYFRQEIHGAGITFNSAVV
jgi:hypothetical protein